MRSILFRIESDGFGFWTPEEEREERGFNVPRTEWATSAIAKALGLEMHQLAMYTVNPQYAVNFLKHLGFDQWSQDSADLVGEYYGEPSTVRGYMSFNYQALPGKELEFVSYDGHMDFKYSANGSAFMSHISSYVDDVDDSVAFIKKQLKMEPYHRFITSNHSNPRIAGKKCFKEAIYETTAELGFNLKLIQKVLLDG